MRMIWDTEVEEEDDELSIGDVNDTFVLTRAVREERWRVASVYISGISTRRSAWRNLIPIYLLFKFSSYFSGPLGASCK